MLWKPLGKVIRGVKRVWVLVLFRAAGGVLLGAELRRRLTEKQRAGLLGDLPYAMADVVRSALAP
jgi:hypothetical protein